MTWDGQIERRNNPTDHDNVIRLLVMFAEHIKNFDNHILEDKIVAKDVRFHSRMVYIAIGGLGMLQIIIGIIKH